MTNNHQTKNKNIGHKLETGSSLKFCGNKNKNWDNATENNG